MGNSTFLWHFIWQVFKSVESYATSCSSAFNFQPLNLAEYFEQNILRYINFLNQNTHTFFLLWSDCVKEVVSAALPVVSCFGQTQTKLWKRQRCPGCPGHEGKWCGNYDWIRAPTSAAEQGPESTWRFVGKQELSGSEVAMSALPPQPCWTTPGVTVTLGVTCEWGPAYLLGLFWVAQDIQWL